ncbi:MAG: anti-sigma F factor [Ruminococcaceae bacterium]|nr:anti-sigma F factor [Oscillospiraceae bacterium]
MKTNNKMKLEFPSLSGNESFARATVAAFVSQLDPTVEEIADIKTALSEGVTNAVIHGYGDKIGIIKIECEINDKTVKLIVEDNGKGIADKEKARQPFYTESDGEERSGMGFTVMETFMDSLEIISKTGEGTKLIMTKEITDLKEQVWGN